jgi:hypothetical protein
VTQVGIADPAVESILCPVEAANEPRRCQSEQDAGGGQCQRLGPSDPDGLDALQAEDREGSPVPEERSGDADPGCHRRPHYEHGSG